MRFQKDKIYGRLSVIKLDSTDKQYRKHWLCKCNCGNEVVVREDSLKIGKTKSCGCLQKESYKTNNLKHGMAYTRTYRIWRNMVQRCTNPNLSDSYKYFGRGITVCDKWLKFENFLADMGVPEDHLSLERIDNDGNYDPSNCRWATSKEQARNTVTNRLVTYQGHTKCISEWSEITGIDKGTLIYRLNQGKSLEEVFKWKAS